MDQRRALDLTTETFYDLAARLLANARPLAAEWAQSHLTTQLLDRAITNLPSPEAYLEREQTLRTTVGMNRAERRRHRRRQPARLAIGSDQYELGQLALSRTWLPVLPVRRVTTEVREEDYWAEGITSDRYGYELVTQPVFPALEQRRINAGVAPVPDPMRPLGAGWWHQPYDPLPDAVTFPGLRGMNRLAENERLMQLGTRVINELLREHEGPVRNMCLAPAHPARGPHIWQSLPAPALLELSTGLLDHSQLPAEQRRRPTTVRLHGARNWAHQGVYLRDSIRCTDDDCYQCRQRYKSFKWRLFEKPDWSERRAPAKGTVFQQPGALIDAAGNPIGRLVEPWVTRFIDDREGWRLATVWNPHDEDTRRAGASWQRAQKVLALALRPEEYRQWQTKGWCIFRGGDGLPYHLSSQHSYNLRQLDSWHNVREYFCVGPGGGYLALPDHLASQVLALRLNPELALDTANYHDHPDRLDDSRRLWVDQGLPTSILRPALHGEPQELDTCCKNTHALIGPQFGWTFHALSVSKRLLTSEEN